MASTGPRRGRSPGPRPPRDGRNDRPAPEPRAPRERTRRRRPAKSPLSEQSVVDAGLAILRRSGLEAVTMRAIAQELDTGAASLYVYVRSRDDLLSLLFDRVAGTIDYPVPDPTRWREQLTVLSLEMLETFESYPGLASLALGNVIPTGPHSMDGAESFLALLLASGTDPQRAAWAADTLFLIIAANAVETGIRAEAAASGSGRTFPYEGLVDEFSELDPERYPNVTKYAAQLAGGEGRDRFLFSIGTVLDGLVANPSG